VTTFTVVRNSIVPFPGPGAEVPWRDFHYSMLHARAVPDASDTIAKSGGLVGFSCRQPGCAWRAAYPEPAVWKVTVLEAFTAAIFAGLNPAGVSLAKMRTRSVSFAALERDRVA
jgi:hypothetical protein